MAELKETICRSDLPPTEWFDRMADAAIRRSCLVVASKRFSIVEVEFYLHSKSHPDEHTHKSVAQLGPPGRFYFHREKSASLAFTLKGLDLTFGPPGVAGGMLIRAVADPECKAVVEGPSLTVNELLRAAGADSVLGLKALSGYADEAFAGGLLRVESRPALAVDIRAGPRIGLKGTKDFVDAPYRYRARPELTKKDKARICAGRLIAEWQAVPIESVDPLSLDEAVDELLELA